jgi:hypothetical protein
VFFVMELAMRKVHIAGIHRKPDEAWIEQVGRNLVDIQDGFLRGRKYLIHDRDPRPRSNIPADAKGGLLAKIPTSLSGLPSQAIFVGQPGGDLMCYFPRTQKLPNPVVNTFHTPRQTGATAKSRLSVR